MCEALSKRLTRATLPMGTARRSNQNVQDFACYMSQGDVKCMEGSGSLQCKLERLATRCILIGLVLPSATCLVDMVLMPLLLSWPHASVPYIIIYNYIMIHVYIYIHML